MPKKKGYMNLTAYVISDQIKSIENEEETCTIKVHFDTPNAPLETELIIDAYTYVSDVFNKGDKVKIISAFFDDDGEPNHTPAIIANPEFEDIFNDKNNLLATFRECNHSLQRLIISRNAGTHYDSDEGANIRLDNFLNAKNCYKLTKNTFTPKQQAYIETWFREYERENKKKLEIMLSIAPECNKDSKEHSIEELKCFLDESFTGMENPKEEIIRHFASTKQSDVKGTVICLVGPPGTGKTQLVKRLGEFLEKPFACVPCSGFTSSLDVLGDREVYTSAYCGRIVDAFYKVKTTDCLMQLDEFDKMPGINSTGMNKDGNPYNAFLEVFSERQITDNFLGVEISCANTIFVCTCNSLDNVPSFIQNRFDVIIHVPAYDDDQLVDIVNRHTIPRLNDKYKLEKGEISFPTRAIRRVLKYIDDFGARRTEHNVESIYKEIIARWVLTGNRSKVKVTVSMVDSILSKTIDLNNPRVLFRQNIDCYSPEVVKKVMNLEEELDNQRITPSERHIFNQQFEYYVALRPDNREFVFDVDSFYKEVNKSLYGMEAEKQLIASLFHELSIKSSENNKRILLIGAPGTGKTELIQAVGKAASMPYVRISLNAAMGSDLRGYGKSYQAADAGTIIREVAKTGTRRVLLHLDEIDKVSAGKGAEEVLMQLLDDSGMFSDDFLEAIPIDFKSAIFIATANDYNSISPALLSRFTVIDVNSYSHKEQRQILSNYIVPSVCKGYDSLHVTVTTNAKDALIRYACSGGVRELKEMTQRVVRETVFTRRNDKEVLVQDSDVYQILGPLRPQRGNRPIKCDLVGLSNGLAISGTGSGLCFAIETRILPGDGIEVTGLPSEVVKDSLKLAISVLSSDYGMDFSNKKIHTHFAEGAVQKDGPSAGTSIFVSLYSAMTNKPVPISCCCTGEIDLYGCVYAVGGIVEKLSAADEAGIEMAFIPNQSFDALTEKERQKLSELKIEVVPVSCVSEIIERAYDVQNVSKAIA